MVGARIRDCAAVLVYELQAHETEGIERYRVTDTYWLTGGTWRLVASQTGPVVEDLDPQPGSIGERGRQAGRLLSLTNVMRNRMS
jgi:hypothetical protein